MRSKLYCTAELEESFSKTQNYSWKQLFSRKYSFDFEVQDSSSVFLRKWGEEVRFEGEGRRKKKIIDEVNRLCRALASILDSMIKRVVE